MGIFNWFKKDKNKKNKNDNVELDDKIEKREQMNDQPQVEHLQQNVAEEILPTDIVEATKIATQVDEIKQPQIREMQTTEQVEVAESQEVADLPVVSEIDEISQESTKVEEPTIVENAEPPTPIVEESQESVEVAEEAVAGNKIIEVAGTQEGKPEVVEKQKKGRVGFFRKIANALKKTKDAISNKIDSIFHKELDDEFFDDLEEILITSDLGYETSEEIIERLRTKCKKEKLKTCDEAKNALRQVIEEIMTSCDETTSEDEYPKVVIVVGVNGVGKTTSIGKLANYYNNLGKKVVVVAGDTFRAAASAQLNVWANRADVKIVKQDEGADSASVVFDGISFAKAKGFDVVLVDTAGRLHNKVNLMEELSKVNRVATKNWENAHFERYIVIDATTGQNAVNQVREFDSAIDLDGIVLTKLDGTAKGGIVVSICHEFEIPVKYVGVGEGIDDLVPFDAQEFVEGII